MPRVALGDLLIDVELSASASHEYSLSGSLLVDTTAGRLELSGITVVPEQPAEAPARRYLEAEGSPPRMVRDDLALQRRDETTTMAAFGENRLIICTHPAELAAEAERIVTSVGLAHDAFAPPTEQVQHCALRPSHSPYFAQLRRTMERAAGWRAQQAGAGRALDDFWEQLVGDPPEDENQLNMMIACATVGFGDLLAPLGFEWRVVCDQWGTSLGMVALQGTANVVVVPDSFVGKRWDRKEARFVEQGLEAIARQVEKMRADWRPN